MDSLLAIAEPAEALSDTPAVATHDLHSTTEGTPACFPRGTRIATLDGDRAVETLASGELLYNVTGVAVRMRRAWWHTGAAGKPGERPIRIHAGSLATGQPARDLVLRADHALYIDDVLVPLALLVNSRSIVWEPVPNLTFWQVELEHGAVLLAENVAVASGPQSDAAPMIWLPHSPPMLNAGFTNTTSAATRVGPKLAAILERTHRRAEAVLPLDQPRLTTAGREIHAILDGDGRHVFQLAAMQDDVSITHRTSASISKLLIQDALGIREVPLDDPALRQERGNMRLPRHYLDGTGGAVQLVVALAHTA